MVCGQLWCSGYVGCLKMNIFHDVIVCTGKHGGLDKCNLSIDSFLTASCDMHSSFCWTIGVYFNVKNITIKK